jgi:hypothetical protein
MLNSFRFELIDKGMIAYGVLGGLFLCLVIGTVMNIVAKFKRY